MKSTKYDGLHYWGAYQPDRRIDFNGYFWTRADGNVLIDPMPLDAAGLEFARDHGGAAAILLTNFDHLRAAIPLQDALSAPIAAPAADRERFGDAAKAIDTWYETAADLSHGLDRDVQVHLLAGGKSALEACFYLKPLQALVFGDLVRSHASGKLNLLPEAKLADRAAAIESLQPLSTLAVRALLLGDGDPVFRGADDVLREFFESLR